MKFSCILVVFLALGATARAQNSTTEVPPSNNDTDVGLDDGMAMIDMNVTESNSTAMPTNTNDTDIMTNSTVEDTTNSTEPSEPNECRELEPGVVQVFMMNSDPTDQIAFFPVAEIGQGVGKLYVTDNAWDGNSSFVTEEGTLEYTIGEGGLAAGTVFAYGLSFPGDKGAWEYTGSFDLSTSVPDNVLIYCLDENDVPHFLLALTYNGNFSDPNLEDYTFSETALPQNLIDADFGSLALPFFPNYLYQGLDDGTMDQLLASFSDPTNYKGSLEPYDIDTEASTSRVASNFFPLVVALDSVVIFTWLLLGQ